MPVGVARNGAPHRAARNGAPHSSGGNRRWSYDRERRDEAAIIAYAVIAAFCGLFAGIYAQFSHGVSSAAMTFMFLYPLVGGAGIFLLIRLLHLRGFTRVSFNAYNSGVATLTIGSLLAGVFEIAGTSSAFQPVFTVAGVAFIVFALAGAVVERAQRR